VVATSCTSFTHQSTCIPVGTLIPPRIQLMGAPCPSSLSPLGVTTATRMLTLLSHPCVIFHDSGYSLFPLPFRQSQIEASIAFHHNSLLDSLSTCQQWRMPCHTSPHMSPVWFSTNVSSPLTPQRSHPDHVIHSSPSSRFSQSSQPSPRPLRTPVARKKPSHVTQKSAVSDSDSDYEEVSSKPTRGGSS
jgi:hypothetical protein